MKLRPDNSVGTLEQPEGGQMQQLVQWHFRAGEYGPSQDRLALLTIFPVTFQRLGRGFGFYATSHVSADVAHGFLRLLQNSAIRQEFYRRDFVVYLLTDIFDGRDGGHRPCQTSDVLAFRHGYYECVVLFFTSGHAVNERLIQSRTAPTP